MAPDAERDQEQCRKESEAGEKRSFRTVVVPLITVQAGAVIRLRRGRLGSLWGGPHPGGEGGEIRRRMGSQSP
jgi:hypothetical protein